jgi:hypothetical protein
LLKVAITFSAPPLSVKTISAMTVGDDVKIWQDCISPPSGVIADSMSALVVPGAKLLPMTVYGPASPRIVIPVPSRWKDALVGLFLEVAPSAGAAGGCFDDLITA